jgi:hypothetical protein
MEVSLSEDSLKSTKKSNFNLGHAVIGLDSQNPYRTYVIRLLPVCVKLYRILITCILHRFLDGSNEILTRILCRYRLSKLTVAHHDFLTGLLRWTGQIWLSSYVITRFHDVLVRQGHFCLFWSCLDANKQHQKFYKIVCLYIIKYAVP